ncbi:MAG TPA: di-heme oxidoredictase family protein [Bacillota bacterium]|nr:di-heme oxidoredictase family protein [Bacillota bacterium]
MRRLMFYICLFIVITLGMIGIFSGRSDSQGTKLNLGDPLPGLTPGQVTAFNSGKEEFNAREDAAEGLGPVFNDDGCGSCHNLGAVGGAGLQFETRVGKVTDGVFDPLVSQGGEVLQAFGIDAPGTDARFNGEHIPPDANEVARRRTTALFGLGLVDATADQTFVNIAAAQPKAVRGRVNMVYNISKGHNTVGKFGWKAQVPTLFQFAGDAYLNEMGITSPQFPKEIAPQGDAALLAVYDTVPDPEDDGEDVQRFTDFMRYLAPPAPQTDEYQEGSKLFEQFGCAQCHVRSITSSPNQVAALSQQTYYPYSDFLLHDMGTLGDGIADQGVANSREMRTAPLWGLHYLNQNNLLHDGRAHSLKEAVLLHDGQASGARDKFAKANPKSQEELLKFVSSL